MLTQPTPFATDPMNLLAAALNTERPEFLAAFRAEIERKQAGEGLDADSTRQLLIAIEDLFAQVYDLRRTVRTQNDCLEHLRRALSYCDRETTVAMEVGNRGLVGNLPDHHGPRYIRMAIKATLDGK